MTRCKARPAGVTARDAQTNLASVALLVAMARPSAAHDLLPGAPGPVDAALHVVLAPELLLVTAAAALLAGNRSTAGGMVRVAVMQLCALLVGLQSQALLLAWPGLWRLPLIAATAVGLLLATGLNLGRVLTLSLVGMTATILGLGLPRESPGLAGVVGRWLGAGTLLICATLAVRLLQATVPPAAGRVVARVAGAWIVAIAALGLAAAYR